jgi:NADP-dependent 3-hydroxy acid dehydrogenase YdfG
VNVSSIGADRYLAGMAVYGATKAAVSYLSRALRLEVAGQGIRVTNLEPGMTGGTELADNFPADVQAMVNDLRSALPAIQPEEVADLISYVVSRPRHVNLPHLVIQPSNEV